MPENFQEQLSDSCVQDIADIDVSHPEDSLPAVSLSDLSQAMQDACARAGWSRLMPVQSLALPYLMEGRDIMIQSRTGSGKTGCYLLPMLPVIDPEIHEPQALVLVPTRELALQVEAEAKTIFSGTDIRPVALYGGVGYGRQLEGLRAGAQIIVGTPGRILDHILRRSLDLKGIRMLVFDEADRMLSIGFYPDMKELQKYLPRHRIRTGLFSATYPVHVLRLAAEFMTAPSMLSLSQKEVYVAAVQHLKCAVSTMDKDRALVRLIEIENPASAIIFCNTKSNVHYVCGVLKGFGYNADELSADLTQSRREEVMGKVRNGEVRFLVATDVAARGIDIPALSHVFLYEPPEDHESYIHRAGRTGRAGCAGTVISLVDIMEAFELDRIAAHYSLNIQEIPDPSDEDVAKASSDRLLALLESRFRSLTGLEKMRVRRYEALARTLATEDAGEEGGGVSMLAMLLDACHQNTLNDLRMPSGEKSVSAEEGRSSRSRRSKGGGGRDGSRRDRQPRGSFGSDPVENVAKDGAEGADGDKSGRRRRRRRRRSGSSENGQPQSAGTGRDSSAE